MSNRTIFAIVLILVAAVSWAAGGQEEASDRPELSLLLSVNGTITFDDSPVVSMAEELSGYTLNIEAPPSSNYWDRMRLVMASSQIPDIHANGVGEDFEKFAGEGLIADIEDKIVDYPNLMRNITPAQWEDGRSATTGRIMAVPRPNATDYWGYMIRKDWLDAVGMEAPDTLEEFKAVSEAFTFQDPDGNGRQDTYGFTFARNLYSLPTEFINTAFGLSVHDGFPDWNGEYTIEWLNPGFVPHLEYLRSLHEGGGLDPEWLTQMNSEGAPEEKFLQGRVGIIFMSQKGMYTLFDENPDLELDNYLFHGPLASPVDGVARMAAPPSNWMAFLMAADGKVDESLDFLDFANSEEGFVLFKFGIEGEHYTSYDIETRTIERTPEQLELSKNYLASGFFFANAYLGRPEIEGGLTEATRAKFSEEWGAVQETAEIVEMPFVKVPELTALWTELPDEVTALETLGQQFVLGEVTKAELEQALADFAANPLVQEAQDAYEAYMELNEVDQ